MSAIQHRQRQQIEQCEIDVEDDAEPQHAPPAVLVLKQIAIDADDHHRAAELLHADFALGKQSTERVENLSRAGLELFRRTRMHERGVGIALPGRDAQLRIGIGRLQRFHRQHRAVKFFAAALRGERERFDDAVAHRFLRRIHGERTVNFFAVHGQHFIARFQAGERGGTVRGDGKNGRLARGGDQNLPERLALIPLRLAMKRDCINCRFPAGAQILDGDVRAGASDDAPRDAVGRSRREMVDGIAVNFQNGVAGQQAGLCGGAGRIHPTDHRGIVRLVARLADLPDDDRKNKRQQ